jgi:hypothetical protein
MTTTKHRKVKGYGVKTELKKIDKLFAGLEKDKALPTFLDFYLTCLILGTAERVNLKAMYPKTHAKLTKVLERHRAKILAMQH